MDFGRSFYTGEGPTLGTAPDASAGDRLCRRHSLLSDHLKIITTLPAVLSGKTRRLPHWRRRSSVALAVAAVDHSLCCVRRGLWKVIQCSNTTDAQPTTRDNPPTLPKEDGAQSVVYGNLA